MDTALHTCSTARPLPSSPIATRLWRGLGGAVRRLLDGGSSGGPWLTAFNKSSGVGTLTSVNSYTYRGVTNAMHGPKFDARTQAVYNTANAASSNAITQ